MKIRLNFNELSSTLGYVNTVLSDKTVEEKMKNVIFLVKDGEATIVGYSPLTFSRTKLNEVYTEDVEGDWDFQVKSGELNKIIASYSSLFKTKVEYIDFEKDNTKIKVSIHEEPIDAEDERLAQTGRFMLDNVPIIASVNNEVHTEFPEESDIVMSADLLIYIDSLFPLMDNNSANSMTSKLHFGKEYVFVVSSFISSFFDNKLPESFKDLTLGYSSVNFLKKLCEGIDNIDVQRTEKYLCIRSGLTEAFLKYQKVRVNITPYVSRMNTSTGIVLDRLYLKDVLKRMSIASQDGVAKMSEMGLEVSNSGFVQTIPVNNKKGDVDNLKFKLSPQVMVKTILGDDSLFPDELFLYFVKTANGYSLYVKDSLSSWFSTIQVRI